MLSETVRRKYVIAVLLLVLAAALLASGCESDFMGGYNSLINQMEAKSSVAEVNEAVGVRLKAPGNVLFPEYYVVSMGDGVQIGQVSFRYGGREYLLRAGKTEIDMTGIWLEGAPLGTRMEAGKEYEDETLPDGTIWSRWYDGDVQYFLSCKDGEMERFKAVEKIAKSG